MEVREIRVELSCLCGRRKLMLKISILLSQSLGILAVLGGFHARLSFWIVAVSLVVVFRINNMERGSLVDGLGKRTTRHVWQPLARKVAEKSGQIYMAKYCTLIPSRSSRTVWAISCRFEMLVDSYWPSMSACKGLSTLFLRRAD
jgi:hypothetical protein